MDRGDWAHAIGLGTIIIIAATVSYLMFLDVMYYYPLAAEDAQNECWERGFDDYRTFRTIPLSPEAYAVRCINWEET